MSEQTLEILKQKFGEAVISADTFRGDATAIVKREKVMEILFFLHGEQGYKQLMDLTVVDYLKHPKGWEGKERYAVVYHLFSYEGPRRIRIKAPVPEENPSIDTACAIWRAADWLEREAWDMFGIVFKDHPNLKRLLMWEGFEGHPLRKDFPHNLQQPRVELMPSDEPLPEEMDSAAQHAYKSRRMPNE